MTPFAKICLFALFAGNLCLVAQEANPSVDFPLHLSGSFGTREVLLVYFTGDGGWNNFNQQMVQEFEKQGYGVVALNTRKYFWSDKTPDIFARDVEQISDYYLKAWMKSSLLIVGYSFGADVASFLPARLSAELQKKVKAIALLSPSASTDFVIRLSDMVGDTETDDRKYKVGPEIQKSGLPTICIFGEEEKKSLKSSLYNNKNLNICVLPGDHQYQNNLALLSQMISLK
jgi:type IV secretory pathway VirJ component